MKSIIAWFKSGEKKPPLSNDPKVIANIYTRRRWQVFFTLLISYGMYYVTRVNWGIVKKPLVDSGVLSLTQIGAIGATATLVYAFGKMFNGFLADRCNIKRFMPFGLFMAGLTNLLFGFSSTFWAFFVLWVLNQWFQSYGSTPCIISLTQWFSDNERATKYGLWSTSHYIGEMLVALALPWCITYYGWNTGFIIPGAVCIVMGLISFKSMYDRPEACGLPSISDYRNDHVEDTHKEKTTWAVQKEVLKMPYVWLFGMSAACMSIARYSINSWGVIYLQEEKMYSLIAAGAMLAITPIAGGIGSAVSGFISDKFFKSHHVLTAVVFAVVEIIAIAAFCMVPKGNPVLDAVALSVFGFAIGILLCFISGVAPMDVVPKKALGAALGTIGFLDYVGASFQEYLNGLLMEISKTVVNGKTVYDFHNIYIFWVSASILMLLLLLPALKARKRD